MLIAYAIGTFFGVKLQSDERKLSVLAGPRVHTQRANTVIVHAHAHVYKSGASASERRTKYNTLIYLYATVGTTCISITVFTFAI